MLNCKQLIICKAFLYFSKKEKKRRFYQTMGLMAHVTQPTEKEEEEEDIARLPLKSPTQINNKG
jgi:hypothetical protein